MPEPFMVQHSVGLISPEESPELGIRSAGYYLRARGHESTRSVVTEYQVAYCIDGKGFIECAGRKIEVAKGWVFINIPGHPHKYYANDRDPWTLCWAHFTGTMAARYFTDMQCRADEPAFEVGWHQNLEDMFKAMLREVARPERHHQLLALGWLHLILATVIAYRVENSHSPRKRFELDMKIIDSYIDTYGQAAQLDSMAALCNLSVPHFIRCFKQRVGYTPFQYAIHRRVSRAADMLLGDKAISIKEAALSVGCQDQHYFSRIFKKVTGASPQAYRERYI